MIGNPTSDMEPDFKGFPTAASMREPILTANHMESANILGPTGSSMMASGKMDSGKAKECGKVPKEINTLDSGRSAKLMAMEFINGSVETSMKAFSDLALNMVKE